MSFSHLVSSLFQLKLASTFLSLLLLLLQPHPNNAASLLSCKFSRLYQFGDSLADTGNLIRQKPKGVNSLCGGLPYGKAIFKHPTGRCSNGLLMIDYIAKDAGLHFLNPYLKRDADFREGVNFAVASSSALPTNFLAKNKIIDIFTNSSLDVQLKWMSKHFNVCTDCTEKMNRSLFILGEFGGNDINYALLEGKTIKEVKGLIPEIVKAIINGVKQVISYGAVNILVPGNMPIGCAPVQLTLFQNSKSSEYDKHKCLKEVNNLAKDQNKRLQEGIEELKREYPNVTIVYVDYYQAYLWIYNNDVSLGFDSMSRQKACCGIGGDYNFNANSWCGTTGVPVCNDPDKFINWDGVHLTQKVYKLMAGRLIDEILQKLKCST